MIVSSCYCVVRTVSFCAGGQTHNTNNICRKIANFTDGYTDRFIPVGILPRVAKKLRYFATITDGYTDGPAIIIDGYTDAFTNGLCTFQSTRLSDVTNGFADGRGKPIRACSSAQFLTDFKKYGGIFKIFGARIN